MAKYVVVEFDSDEDAEGFAGTLEWEGHTATIRVAGVFKKPTMFCECPPSNNPKSVRGAKWGWWLHKDCGKPRKGNVHHPRNLILPKEASMVDYLYIGVKEPRQDAGQAAEV